MLSSKSCQCLNSALNFLGNVSTAIIHVPVRTCNRSFLKTVFHLLLAPTVPIHTETTTTNTPSPAPIQEPSNHTNSSTPTPCLLMFWDLNTPVRIANPRTWNYVPERHYENCIMHYTVLLWFVVLL